MSTLHTTILSPVPDYVTKDELWAAVPYGSQYMVLSKGKQIEVFPTLSDARAFITKKIKASTGGSAPRKPKKSKNPSKGTLTPFLQ